MTPYLSHLFCLWRVEFLAHSRRWPRTAWAGFHSFTVAEESIWGSERLSENCFHPKASVRSAVLSPSGHALIVILWQVLSIIARRDLGHPRPGRILLTFFIGDRQKNSTGARFARLQARSNKNDNRISGDRNTIIRSVDSNFTRWR